MMKREPLLLYALIAIGAWWLWDSYKRQKAMNATANAVLERTRINAASNELPTFIN
jgi:hypothetical protein